jgi:hypothetical protein
MVEEKNENRMEQKEGGIRSELETLPTVTIFTATWRRLTSSGKAK